MTIKLKRLVVLLLILFSLGGCASYPFEEVVRKGMDKSQFISDMRTFGFGRYESIYFNKEDGIEILIPRIEFYDDWSVEIFRFSDDAPQIVMLENVTKPLPYYLTIDPELYRKYCDEWNPTTLKCAYYGDGELIYWVAESELQKAVASGDGSAKLILEANQIRHDFISNLLKRIMKDHQVSELEARKLLFDSEGMRNREHTEASLENAKRETERQKKIESLASQKYKKTSPEKTKTNTYANSWNNQIEEESNTSDDEKPSTSYSLGSFAGSFIGAVADGLVDGIAAGIEAKVAKELGVEDSNTSSEISEKNQKAIRRMQTQQRLNDLQWTAPIR